MKSIRILFSFFILLIVVFIFAFACLVFFIDPNTFKPLIIAEVKKQTGYELVIDGNLAWSFYPRLSVVAKHMLLRAPNERMAFLELQQVEVATTLYNMLHRNKPLVGEIDISELRFANLHANHVYIGLQCKDQVLTLGPFTASLYQGKLHGWVKGEALMALPKWSWDLQLNNVALAPLLRDLNGKNNKMSLSGVGQLTFQGSAQGVAKAQIIHSLNGSSHLQVDQGKWVGIDLNYFVQSADALINKQPLPAKPEAKETPFEKLIAFALIKQGVVDVNVPQFSTNTFTANATGTINLLTQLINMQIKMNAQQILKTSWQIPLVVQGELHDPSVSLDMEAVGKFIASQEIDKVKSKVQEEIQQHIPGQAGEFLQNLLRH